MRGIERLAQSLFRAGSSDPVLHFFIFLLCGGHSSSEPRLPIPNRTVKRVCADDSVPFAHAKVGYRHAIFKRKSPASQEDRAFFISGVALEAAVLHGIARLAQLF